jgi:hypothetical protein
VIAKDSSKGDELSTEELLYFSQLHGKYLSKSLTTAAAVVLRWDLNVLSRLASNAYTLVILLLQLPK